MVRISLTNTSGARRSRRASSASNAATACSRPTKNSLWSSSPWLGVWSRRKCGQPVQPRPGDAQLLGARVRGQVAEGMERGGRPPRAEQVDRRRRRRPRLGDPPLAPHLVDDGAAPPREQADAVARRGELVEVVAQRGDRQALVHVLSDAVRRLDASVRRVTTPSAPSETTDPANASPSAVAAERDELAVGPDQLHRHDGRGQVRPAGRPTRASRSRRRRPRRCGAGTPGCGARSRLVRAAGPRSPYRIAPSIVTVRAAESMSITRGSPASERWSPCVSASPLKAWRDPSTRREVDVRTASWTASTDAGSSSRRRVVLEVARPVPHAPRLPASAAGTVKP